MGDQKLWRYYDLIKFLTFINGEMYFARADKFKDKYEGAIPKQNYINFVAWMAYGCDEPEKERVKIEFLEKFNEKKKKAALSCWHLNESESAAMWEIYSKAGHGIAISSTISKLEKVEKPVDFELEMFKVQYIDFDKEYSEDYNYYELLPFKNKKREFLHEQEYRMMLYQINPLSKPFESVKFPTLTKSEDIVKHGFVSKLNDIPPEGIKVKVNPSEIICEIIASPYMQEYEVQEIQRLLNMINKEKATNFIINRSRIYDSLIY